MLLERWSREISSLSVPHSMVGLQLGTRMTVVRLRHGALWIHSPVNLDAELISEIRAHGRVEAIVCPNLFHHSYATLAADVFPDAKVYAPRRLRRKRRDLRIDVDLESVSSGTWGGEIIPLHIDGCMLDETVFVHPESRTVISADLVENIVSSSHWFTRAYLRSAGIYGRAGWSRWLRPLFRDRTAAIRSIDTLLEYDFDRLLIAHGVPIDHGAKETIRGAFEWLRPRTA